MAGVSRLVALLLLLALAAAASASSIATGDHMQLGLLASHGKKQCTGTVGECGFGSGADADGDNDVDAEGELGSAEGELGSADGEAHRRFLQSNTGYISYGALRRGTVPCNRRGASYYNCRAGGQANPYRRGCSRITRCRG